MMQENPIDPRLDEISDCLYRVAAKAVVIQDGKMLMVREGPTGYGVPGGGIDHGRSTHETIVRELEEEIGVTLDSSFLPAQPQFVSVSSIIRRLPRVTLYFVVSPEHPEISPTVAELPYRWVTKQELQQLELRPNVASVRDQLLAVF